MMSLFLSSLTIYYTKITKSGKMTVPLYGISLFFELDAWHFDSSIAFWDPKYKEVNFYLTWQFTNVNHITGKMKISLSKITKSGKIKMPL